MKYQLAIFDLDGTILNTLQDLADSVNYALSLNGFPKRTVEEVCRFVGNGIGKLIQRAVPAESTEEQTQKVFEDFKEYYRHHYADVTQEYSGITPLFEKLHRCGIKIAVVSNKADFAVQSLCKDFFDGQIDYCVGERENVRRKPAPDSVNEVMHTLHISKENTVYIGDSDVDINTAKNAQIDCISVSWGFRDTAFLNEHGASVIVNNTEELYRTIMT